MDSLTQAVLGASIGEAVLGKKVGNKAAAWGAAAGTLPDLDVLLNPFLSDVAQLVYHRSFTHALLFGAVVAPGIGWLLVRLHRTETATQREWSWLIFLALFTHPLLDCFTTYGTQIFQPFSNYPVSFNTLFIIDPLYTVPLATALLVALQLRRGSRGRRRAITIGLTLSCLYVLLTVVNKNVARSSFEDALQAQGIPYESLAARPTPLNSLLWTAQAVDGDGYWIGLYSLLDGDRPITFKRLDRNAALLDDHRTDPDVQRLLWFSRGYYIVQQEGENLIFSDIRFGRGDSWLQEDGDYIFSFRIPPITQSETPIEQLPVGVSADAATWVALFNRILGR